MSGARGESARLGAVDIRIREGVITEVAPDLSAEPGERTLDATDCVIYPGWINTHNHLFQSLLKAVPEGLNCSLNDWLSKVTYARMDRYDPEILRAAARLGMVEQLLAGVTTCADHHILYSADGSTESGDQLFDIADEFGMRFVFCRGGAIETSQTQVDSGGVPLKPESMEQMVSDVERLHAAYHETGPRPMRRVVMAPTTPTFSLSPLMLRELASVSRRLGVHMHSHLSETTDYVSFCRKNYHCLPVEFVAENDWLGPDVWYAHVVHAQDSEIRLLYTTDTGVSHCPSSNCRLGSGIAPVVQMATTGVPVALGADGCAANESGSMLRQAHLAWLMHRGNLQDAAATSAEQVIHWGTASGARIMGMESVGRIAPGEAADLVIYDLDHPRFMGFHDLAIAPVAAGEPVHIRASLIAGKMVVEDGRIPGLDMEELRRETRAALEKLRDAA